MARSLKAESTRERLRAAGVATISQTGYHGTTTRDIARTAGLSTAALYVHYETKEELLYDISREGHTETLALVRAALRESNSPVRRLELLMSTLVEYHAREHTKAIIINRELSALDPGHRAEIRQLRRELQAELEVVLQQGIASGDFELPDPRAATIALLSLGVDVARWYRDSGDWSPADVAERYTAIALRIAGVRQTG